MRNVFRPTPRRLAAALLCLGLPASGCDGDGGGPPAGPSDVGHVDRDDGDIGGGPLCTPVAEVCNGVDDDCDGLTDEGLGERACGEGGCRRSVLVCLDGRITEEECAPGPPTIEVCDGVDDDCDGTTDEAEDGGPLSRPCYTGPEGTEGTGACHGGARTCTGGDYPQEDCPGEVTPVLEAAGDGVDGDCDGLTDEGFAALGFGGQRDSIVRYVDPPGDRALGLEAASFVLEAWIRPDALTPYRTNAVVARRAESSGEGWLLAVAGWGGVEGVAPRGLVFLVGRWPEGGADGAFLASPEGAVSFEDGVWHHAAVWFRNGAGVGGAHEVTLYVDGRQVARQAAFPRGLVEPASVPPLWIGADPYEMSGTFEGVVGDVKVTLGAAYGLDERACAEGERCFEPPACLPEGGEAAVAHWPLHEGTGAVANDVSGSGRHGTITARPETRWRAGEACAERR